MSKITIYQVLPRLFGNKKTGTVPYGTIKENGVGKFNDFTPLALKRIKELGITHIWYTGVIEHATVTDYSGYGIHADYAEIVKGRAGSPYAIKDYFDVHPDHAENVTERMNEFHELVKRTHETGMKVLIDFVPNHLARNYQSDASPDGFEDFGKNDDTSVEFSAGNDFYYIPGEDLEVPSQALEDSRRMQDKDKYGYYRESPAKVTGNDVFSSKPSYSDWYETIKLNYGIDLKNGGQEHFDPVPSVWPKMLQVLKFWSKKGIDGFRVDMAEMVPVEFWKWVIPQIKMEFPGTIFIGEIYKPQEYKKFIESGFDFLYDKKGFYETARHVMERKARAEDISRVWQNLDNLDAHMLRFLENHDEERIGSRQFACEPENAIPGLLLAATMNKGPLMIYSGQEFGEPAAGVWGFSGDDGKTSIFDYCHVPEHQKWMNKGLFDGAMLSDSQKKLLGQYQKIVLLAGKEKAVAEGSFYDLLWANQDKNWHKSGNGYAYLRHCDEQVLLFLLNFDCENELLFDIRIPEHAMDIIQYSNQYKILLREIYPGKLTREILSQILMNEGMDIFCPPSSGKVLILEK
jgi:glycosidase